MRKSKWKTNFTLTAYPDQESFLPVCFWRVYSLLSAVKNSSEKQLKGRSFLASGLQVDPSWYGSRNVSEVRTQTDRC